MDVFVPALVPAREGVGLMKFVFFRGYVYGL